MAIATLGPIPETEVEMEEEVALLLAREPVERQRVVAGDQMRVQHRLLAAAGHPLERLGRHGEPVTDARGLDHDVIGAPHHHLPANRRDHADPTPLAAPASAWAAAHAPRGRWRRRARRPRDRTRAAAEARAACRPCAAPAACRPRRCRRRPSSPPAACSRSTGCRAARRSACATPRAWPTPIAERTFLPKYTSSSASAAGSCQVISSARPCVDLGQARSRWAPPGAPR